MMRTTGRTVAMLAVLATAGCTRLTPEQQFVQDVATALGGADRLKAVRGLTLAGSGRQWNLGQDLTPGLAEQTFTIQGYTRVIDLTGPRMRTTMTRVPAFAYFQGPQAQTQIQGVDGEAAYNGGDPAKLTRAAASAAADRRTERYHHPLVLVRAALDGAAVSAVRTTGTERAVDVTTDAGPVTLVVGADHRPIRITSPSTHPNLGDVTLTTAFPRYGDAGGLNVPVTFTTAVDDFVTGEYAVTTQTAADAVDAPDAVMAAAPPTPAAPNVAVEEVAPGVWFLAGQSHHSVVVAFSDRLVLIEAPQSEARTRAVIEKARTLKAGTPLTHVVMSHHHFDHSTGLRAAIAEGLTVVTHQGNVDFVRAMAARPFTRQPDALAKAARPVTVEGVNGSQTITDGTRSLVIYDVTDNPHSHTMVMAYLPKERVLVEVDAFSPGGTYHPYAANLLGHIDRLALKVDRIVPLHGAIATRAELAAAAKGTPTN